MNEIKELLAEQLDLSDVRVLELQVTSIEALAVKLCGEYRAAESDLADLRGRLYNPSLKTELERRIDLERNTREQQLKVDELKDLVALVKQRIELGRTLLEAGK